MKGIDTPRWILGGVVAGIVILIVESAASGLYMEDLKALLEARGLRIEMTAGLFGLGAVGSLLVGLTLVFLYAAARPRFGPGPGTAVLVAVALWLGGYLATLLGGAMLGLFPGWMMALWGAIGLAELVLAALAGGWVYREQG